MNRVLENGGNIKMNLINSKLIGVDTKEDLIEVEKELLNDSTVKKYLKLS